MSDTQDPLQDLVEQLLRKPAQPASDKKIVFGVRKATAGTEPLLGIPSIIEAPFPYERTLHWNPGFPNQDGKTNQTAAESDGSPDGESQLRANDSEYEPAGFAAIERPPSTPNSPESASNTAVIVSQEVLLKVNEHVSQSLERELGGFLLGNRYRCPSTLRDYVIIDQYSPAKFTESTEVNLAFTHEAWAQLSDELSGKFLGKLLIGWYHSHPRMDVFLSSHDMEIQTERFSEPWMVALVLEPEKHLGGFFCARDGRVRPNSPVDFFELLERNSRDSVMAWENHLALDPETSSAPVMSPTNTASLAQSSSPEIARLQLSKKDPGQKRRKVLLICVGLALLLVGVAAGIVKRQALKRWFQNRGNELPVVQPEQTPAQTATTPAPSPSPSPAAATTPIATTPGKAANTRRVRQNRQNRKDVNPAPRLPG